MKDIDGFEICEIHRVPLIQPQGELQDVCTICEDEKHCGICDEDGHDDHNCPI